ncbi:hypothetical protein [Salmonella enterica]|uniref:hypothetical protein n=1 Tax=Salmonella enterica TaxID=28901 RepID=UPI001F1B36C3|nr:hypothetical protein [Salmonella enterica]
MKMLSGINIPFFKKSKKDENGDLEQSYVKKDESAKGRFLDAEFTIQVQQKKKYSSTRI